MSDDIAVSVKNVSKKFLLPHEKNSSVKSIFTGLFNTDRSYSNQLALKDISFDIKKGEFFGIVGRNGSGKSTLLKIIAGIYQPTKGKVMTNGKLVPFIELGVGFNPELTGRENVFLNGALLGFTRNQIKQNYKKIVSFAELEDHMDVKLKNYSSGMQVRLAFACATMAKAEILLIDEVLAVGDADFQRKCFNYFKQLKKVGTTVIFVTHDMNAVREYCDRGILINNNKLELNGTTEEISELYTKLFNLTSIENSNNSDLSDRWGSGALEIKNKPKIEITKDALIIDLNIISNQKIENPVIGISIKDATNQVVIGTNTKILKIKNIDFNKNSRICFKFPNILSSGAYTITVAVHDTDGVTVYDWWDDCCSFAIENMYNSPYSISPTCEVVLK